MADKLEEFHQHFTPAVLVQTREFQCVRNTLRRNNSSIDNIAPIEPQIRHEFESSIENLRSVLRALNDLNSLLIKIENKYSLRLAKIHGLLEECQRAMYTITLLIFQLNSMSRNERLLLSSGSGEANAADLNQNVYQMVRKLVENLSNLEHNAHYAGEGCNTDQ